MSTFDRLQEWAIDQYQEKGIQVFLKTDIGPELKIYDSDAPASNGEGLPIKYGVQVRDRSGNSLGKYGDYPATNPVKAAAVLAVIGLGLFVLTAGIMRSVGK